jgi:pyruvate/2-oxoglutarate dehydrogenase complex dihydrolipoamide dehydrogenase (E3) component/uncharacterized membrane protein YdjX (TVP38/TMEM64 family)
MIKKRLTLAVLLALAVGAFFAFDLQRFLNLAGLQSQQQNLQALVNAYPLRSAVLFFLGYMLATALSIPGATILTLSAGAVFGLWWGTLIASFAASAGATLAFLSARFLLRDSVQQRFGQRLKSFNDGIAKDGAFYLLSLRLLPAVPFVLINLLMGLTLIRLWTYYWVSQLGMLPGALVYVYAGTQLARIDSLQRIFSPGLIWAFALLSVFPLLAKSLLGWLQRRRRYARWPQPRQVDYNMVVIGAGAAGLVSSYIGSAVNAKVALVERERMGGDCLYTGCVPSKALIRSARLAAELRRADEFGLAALPQRQAGERNADFAAAMARVRRVIKAIEPHDSVERYTDLGVECVAGRARIVSPFAVEVTAADGSMRTLTTRSIVIAAGARPRVPAIAGLDQVRYVTSETIWEVRELPRRLLVLGGGAVGCELAQAFARFGSEVTVVEMAPRLLAREDEEVSALLEARFRADGVRLLSGCNASRFVLEGGESILLAEQAGQPLRVGFDLLLCALGRVPNTSGYGLEELGIGATPAQMQTETQALATNDYLQTLYPNIYAAGDVAGPFQYTHAAAHQAWYATVNALFGRFRMFRADYSAMPSAVFTEPELARVGLNEQQAQARNIRYEVTRYNMEQLDRAITDEAALGFIKVLTVPGRDRILGVTIVGAHAAEMIAEYVLAMKHGLGLNKILGTVHLYPSMAEANKYAAGAWKRAHAPQRLLAWAGRYHRWRRG